MRIDLPEGYAFEAGSAPKAIVSDKLVTCRFTLKYAPNARRLFFDREHAMLSKAVGVRGYALVKTAFDRVHESDGHLLTLKRVAATDAPAADDAAP